MINKLNRSFVILLSIFFPVFVQAQWNGTTDIYSTNSGNVGIGTSNPTAKLEVNGGVKIVTGNSNTFSVGTYPGGNHIYFDPTTAMTSFYMLRAGNIQTLPSGQSQIRGEIHPQLLFLNGAYIAGYQSPVLIKRTWPGIGNATLVLDDEGGVSESTYKILQAKFNGIEKAYIKGDGGAFFGGSVSVGTNISGAGLSVNGPFTLADGTQGAGKVLVSNAAGLASWQAISTTGSSQWTTTGSDIYYNTGNVGIGTATPVYKLDITGTVHASGSLALGSSVGGSWEVYGTYSRFSSNATTDALELFTKKNISNIFLRVNNGGRGLTLNGLTGNLLFMGGSGETLSGIGNNNGSGDLTFLYSSAANVQTEGARLTNQGNFGLGTSSPSVKLDVAGDAKISGILKIATDNFPATGNYKLAVGGDIIAEKVRVKLQSSGWPDFVFEPTYELPGIQEIEKFILEHKHLPGVPAAATIEKEGLDLGDGQALLLKKIEELTLHLIEVNKRVQKLELENAQLKHQEPTK
ncbi:MAG: hypothetical protein NTW29_09100 [Bacteroidetes bacterium]|nr:hypothetical protein [Bacteroidota bacterium]